MKKYLSTALVIFGLLFFTSTAFADTLGPNYPGNAGNFGSGGVNWNNPTRISADDGLSATATLPFPLGDSNRLAGSNYGFSIPANAIISGIEVSIERKSSASTLNLSIKDKAVKLTKGADIVGDNKAKDVNWTTNFHIANYGSPTDLWNTTWTPEEINASSFGVALSVRSEALITTRTASVNYIRVTVTYSLPTTGSLSVTKTAIGSDDTFSFSGSGTIGDFSLITSSGTAVQTFSNLTPGSFTVVENELAGWDQTSNDCTDVAVTAGNVSTCTIVNTKRGSITVNKAVTGPNGEELADNSHNFSVLLNGANEQTFNPTMPTKYENLVPGTYTLTETENNSDYEFVSFSSDADTELAGAQVVVGAGADVEITVTNKQKLAHLTVIKHVDNSHGLGAQIASDFMMNVEATNASESAFAGNEEGVTISIYPGTFSVTEAENSFGYAMGKSEGCSGTAYSNDHITCTITNSFLEPGKGALIIQKNVVNDNNGTAQAGDFDLFYGTTITLPGEAIPCPDLVDEIPCVPTFAPDTQSPGPSIQVNSGEISQLLPGTYSVFEELSEQQNEDYLNTGTVCTDNNQPLEGTTLSLQAGHVYICTITNDDKQKFGTLIIRKVVINDNTGEMRANNFTYVLGDNSPVAFNSVEGSTTTGQNILSLVPGTYTVTEPANAGYTSTSEGCTNIVLGAGETKTCVFTNNDIPPQVSQPETPTPTNGGGGTVPIEFLTPSTNTGTVLGASTETQIPASKGEVLGAETCNAEYLTEYMFYTKKNNPQQVKLLQSFLNEHLGTQLEVSGVYNKATRDAVSAFQVKYAVDVLKPWKQFGLKDEKKGTGNVYKTTKWKINMLKCQDLNLPAPQLP